MTSKPTIQQTSSSSTPPILSVLCRMLRSPSHESMTTDLSLFSVSSLASDALGRHHRLSSYKEHRGTSPHPDIKGVHLNRQADIPEVMWFDEGNDLIRSCAVLSNALGMQKSFSTSDITQLPSPDAPPLADPRHAISELALNSLQRSGYMMIDHPRLDHTSRSCSTWVAVGELASTSQLPSPHGGPACSTTGQQLTVAGETPPAPQQQPPTFTAADLIRSVNEKVRQIYIRRKLLTTYRAIERLSQSEFNLDRLEAAAVAAHASNTNNNNCPGPTELIVPVNLTMAAGSKSPIMSKATTPITTGKLPVICPQLKKKISININQPNLTIQDIEKERGKPLSKYDRNMLIFNWLHSLDETATVGVEDGMT